MSVDLTNPIFHDDDAAREHLEAQRWPHGPECPHCGEKRADAITKMEGKAHRAGLYNCKSCRQQFSVTVGTVFERSKIPLAKWVLATHLMAASKKGMSAKQIERMLGVTYKTAWFMMHRIREAMTPSASEQGPIGGAGKAVESDETFVGGKAKNVHKGKPTPKKYPVIALVDRKGDLIAKHVPDVTAKTVKKVLFTNVRRTSDLKTDDSLVYYWLGGEFRTHEAVNHSKGEYVRDGKHHVNTAESFFALLKRGITGSFHSVSEAHLQRYASEFAFRWNYRKVDDAERANAILKAAQGKRLTYRRPDEAENG